MTSDDQQVIDRLEAYLPFLRIVEEADVSVAERISHQSDDPSVTITIGGFSYPDEVHEMSRILHEADWMQKDYLQVDVPRYRDDPERVAAASLLTLKRLLTAYERGERFQPGYRAGALDGGFIRRIVERLVDLREAEQ